MELTPTITELWDNLKERTSLAQKHGWKISVNKSAHGLFQKRFEDLYRTMKDVYMRKGVVRLDRHKVAAVTIIAAIESKAVLYNGADEKSQVFLGCEMLATEVALAWMLEQFNLKIEKAGYKPIGKYRMPEAYTCDTPYFEILCRSLYYAQRDGYKLNPIDISEKLYLLEYITMLAYGIPQSALKE